MKKIANEPKYKYLCRVSYSFYIIMYNIITYKYIITQNIQVNTSQKQNKKFLFILLPHFK